jgi:hypothetical protein
MVEIPIFWFLIHITNGLYFMHRKWHTGNQYRVKSTENRMRQKYSHASNFPYVFHIKLQFFRSLPWSQFTPDFDNFYINKNRMLCSFFKITTINYISFHHMNLQFLFSRFIEKGLRNCRLYTRNPYYEVMLYTDNGQKYSQVVKIRKGVISVSGVQIMMKYVYFCTVFVCLFVVFFCVNINK